MNFWWFKVIVIFVVVQGVATLITKDEDSWISDEFDCSLIDLENIQVSEPARGVKYIHLQCKDRFFLAKFPLNNPHLSVHILEIDPDFIRLEPVHAGNKLLCLETLSSMAKRKGAFAAINGGFYCLEGAFQGASLNALKMQGQWLFSPVFNRGAIGWSNQKELSPLIDRLKMHAELEVNKYRFPIEGINRRLDPYRAILYTSSFYSSTLTEGDCTEISIDQSGMIIGINKGSNHSIPLNGWVYAIGANKNIDFPLDLLGEKVNFHISTIPLLHPENHTKWDHMDHIIGSHPILVSNGIVRHDFDMEKIDRTIVTYPCPRSAIGIKRNGHLVFVVVDGRIINYSVGLSLKVFGAFMAYLGCVDVLNLDGGGGSTLYIKDKVVNIPSDYMSDVDYQGHFLLGKQGRERQISDGILIFLKS